MSSRLSEIIEEEEAAAQEDEEETSAAPGDSDVEPDTEPLEHEAKVKEAERAIDMAEREKKLKAEDTRHENALKRVYGDEFADHAFCPLCIGQGFLVPIPAGQQPDEIWEAITALSGRTPAAEYEHPAELVKCERCNGFGKVATGARSDTTAVIPCSACDARGYFDTKDPVHRGKLGLAPDLPPAPAITQFPTFHVPNGGAEENLQPPNGWHSQGKPGADSWDRWPGHPRYGIDPSVSGKW